MRGGSRCLFYVTIIADDSAAQIGQRRPAASFSAMLFFNERLPEQGVAFVDQRPCAPIRHAKCTSCSRDGPELINAFHELNLSGSKASTIKNNTQTDCWHSRSHI